MGSGDRVFKYGETLAGSLTSHEFSRLRPSALNRCSFSRGAAALIRSPIEGPLWPGMRTRISPVGNSPGLGLTAAGPPPLLLMPRDHPPRPALLLAPPCPPHAP